MKSIPPFYIQKIQEERTMKKRLISMLLLVVMVLGMLPATALAASSEEEALGEVNIYNGRTEALLSLHQWPHP